MSSYDMWNLVLVDEESASSFLSRSLLYNSWDFELVVPDSLERECIEELCTYEEAREVFEDNAKTVMLLRWCFYSSNTLENLWWPETIVLFCFCPKHEHLCICVLILIKLLNLLCFFFHFRNTFGPVIPTVKVMMSSPSCHSCVLSPPSLLVSVILFDIIADVLICYIFKVNLVFYGFIFNP